MAEEQRVATFRARKLRTIDHIPSVEGRWDGADDEEEGEGGQDDGAEAPNAAGIYAGLARSASSSLHDCCINVARALHYERFGVGSSEDAETLAWAEAAALVDGDDRHPVTYRSPEEDAAISLSAIALMSRPASDMLPLGSGTAMSQIDRLARQTDGRVIREALRTILAHAPALALDAAHLYGLRRRLVDCDDSDS